jgi:hypothetical protein
MMLELDGDPHSGVFIRFSLAQAVVPRRVGLKPAAIESRTQAHVEGTGRLDLDLTGSATPARAIHLRGLSGRIPAVPASRGPDEDDRNPISMK